EGRQRSGVGGYTHAPAHRAPGGAANGDDVAGDRRHRLPRVALEREPEVGLAVEARLVDLHHPSRICALRPHPLSHSPHCGVRPHPLSPSPRCGEGGRPIEFDAPPEERVRPAGDRSTTDPEEPHASSAGLPLESRTLKPTLSLAASAHKFTTRPVLFTYTWNALPPASW